MIPRNLTFFRFSKEVARGIAPALNEWRLPQALEAHAFRDIGPQELSTSGFVPLTPDFTISSGAYEGFALRIAEKILPASSVKEAVAKKCEIIEALEGRKPGGRERKRIKDDVLNEMLPHVPVRYKTIRGWLDYDLGWAVIDTSSRKMAEYVLSQLRQALGSFPAVGLAPEESPRLLLTMWLADADNVPGNTQLGDECQLRDPATASGARVTFVRQDLETEEVRDHLRAGKQVFRLGVIYDDRVTMVLDDSLVVRKFKLTDVVLDEQAEDEAMGEISDFVLATREVAKLYTSLANVFKVPRP